MFIVDPFKSSYESFDFWTEWIQESAIFFPITFCICLIIFGVTNTEMKIEMTNYIHLYRE